MSLNFLRDSARKKRGGEVIFFIKKSLIKGRYTRSESSIEYRKRRGKKKKKILGILLILCVLFSFGLAGAATVSQDDLPKHLRSAVPGSYMLWFPAVPDMPGQPFYWKSYIIIANWYGVDVTVSVTATAFSDDPNNQPTTKTYTLGPYQKMVRQLSDFGFSNTIADIWITSNAPIFGATVLLMDSDTYEVLTAIPHIDIQVN